MPINFVQQRKKQKYLTLIVMAALIVTAIILYFGYFKKSEPILEEIPSISVLKEIEIDFVVLDSQFLQESQIFENVPPFEGETGRENPFLPY